MRAFRQAGLGAGSGNCVVGHFGVTRCGNGDSLQRGFHSTFSVGEVFAAIGAVPICRVTRGGAGGIDCFNRDRRMIRCGNVLHHIQPHIHEGLGVSPTGIVQIWRFIFVNRESGKGGYAGSRVIACAVIADSIVSKGHAGEILRAHQRANIDSPVGRTVFACMTERRSFYVLM